MNDKCICQMFWPKEILILFYGHFEAFRKISNVFLMLRGLIMNCYWTQHKQLPSNMSVAQA